MMRLARVSEWRSTRRTPARHQCGHQSWEGCGRRYRDRPAVLIVPRWAGDTNFMTAMGETRVLPEISRQPFRGSRPVFEGLSKPRCVGERGEGGCPEEGVSGEADAIG